jgi:hypothetical protein
VSAERPPPKVPPERFYWDGRRWVRGAMPRGFKPRIKQRTLFYVRGPRIGPIRFAGSRVTNSGCACLVICISLTALVGVVDASWARLP